MTAAATANPATIPAVADPAYTRLHITPFDPDLFGVVLSTAVRPSARNVSYHSVQTFPEKRYGFVDLPADAADKLRKKLNGAVLKGVKLSVEPARPERAPSAGFSNGDKITMPKKPQADGSDATTQHGHKRADKKDRKDKKDNSKKKAVRAFGSPEPLVGIQLEPGRQVKRGWTEPDEPWSSKKAKKDRKDHKKDRKNGKDKDGKTNDGTTRRKQKSKYTDRPECLIKTILPANKVTKAGRPAADGAAADDEDDAARARRRRRDKAARAVVVHEFAHTTKFPTFLKSTTTTTTGDTAARPSLEYVDGKGWVDTDGTVVQPLASNRPRAMSAKVTKEAVHEDKNESENGDDSDTDSSASSSDAASDTSSSSTSGSEEEDEDEEVGEEDQERKTAAVADETTSTPGRGISSEELTSPRRPKSSSSAKSLTIKIPPPPATPAPASKVHPLEALYKQTQQADGSGPGQDQKQGQGHGAKTPTAATTAPFRFFGTGSEDDDLDDVEETGDGEAMDVVADDSRASRKGDLQPPMTPFTRQELEWRHVRSAAPTPDTAHPSRMRHFKWPAAAAGGSENEEEEEDDDDDEDDDEDDNGEAREDDARMDEREDSTGGTTNAAAAAASENADPTAEDDFAGWFWANRGDLNRAWKRRRKTAAKEKRYRENRARAERAI
ncbi:hypothetical protein SPI_02284 [Niveomyces insectorum RCEF 264]|uniref:Nucleotide-binding, alpha-beta plait n=1 Tax=Niveomyces insectorum RCEF 264 TaxID=1081102 RepID=A0A167XWL1_9HYPO|nr:hypothetical protein SPI_02284 [Niveomyces insectorum RCEF 264]